MKSIVKIMLTMILAMTFLVPAKAVNIYKVTLELGEGFIRSGIHTEVVEVEEGKTVDDSTELSLYNIQNPGYSVIGFAIEDEKEPSFNGEELNFYQPHKDITITALYAKQHTVTLDYNGGNLYGEASDEYKVAEGITNYFSSSTPKSPKDSETFAGWCLKKTGDPEYTMNDLESYAYTSDMTFYAIYKPAVTITLIGNGGVFWSEEKASETSLKVPQGCKNPSYGNIPSADGKCFEGWSKTQYGKVDFETLKNAVFDSETTLYAVFRDYVNYSSYTIEDSITMHVGETVPFPITISPSNSDYAIIGVSHDASVAKPVLGSIQAFREGVAEIVYMFQSPTNYKSNLKLLVTVLPIEFGFQTINGKKYWYEEGKKQGVYGDPKNIWDTTYDKIERGREIYDPKSDGWYWLDAVYDGAAAFGKEVWMPYIYQNEDTMPDPEKRDNANKADDGMKELVYQCMVNKTGKWVRYDNNGKMIKGWVTIEGELALAYPDQAGNTYYYDTMTGTMAKGTVTLEGKTYYFDPITGVLQK